MGFLPNNKNAFCDRSDFPIGATTNISLPCGSFYKHVGGGTIALKEIPTIPSSETSPDKDYKEPIPPAACLPVGYKFTSPKGVEVTGISDCSFDTSSNFCSDETYTANHDVVSSLKCPFGALSGPDQLVTKNWMERHASHGKHPNRVAEPEGGCYIPGLFPSCNSVDRYVQQINSSISALASMYASNSIFSTETTTATNCLKVYIENANVEGDANFDQSIEISSIDMLSLDSMLTKDFIVEMSVIVESMLNIMSETVTEGCKDRVPGPTLPDGLTAENITDIKEQFESETFVSNVIDIVKDIHACNNMEVTLFNVNIGGNINISQEIMIESYIAASIKAVIKESLDFKGGLDLKSTLTSMKKNRMSEESYYGKDFEKGSSIPLIICIVLGIGLVSFGVCFGIASALKKKKTPAKRVKKPLKYY